MLAEELSTCKWPTSSPITLSPALSLWPDILAMFGDLLLGWGFMFHCMKLTQGLQRARKNIRIQPNGPSPNVPKGPRRGPLGPFPRGPWGPWARRALLLSSQRRGDITTERHCNRTAVRRSEFIGSAGMRASVKNSAKIVPR